jgi:glyoxylase-like metal-dependent hydrolase (beta-lactamase superfamily II)
MRTNTTEVGQADDFLPLRGRTLRDARYVSRVVTLEDDFQYVLRKAMKGCGLAASEVAERAGVPQADVQQLVMGRFSAATARVVAPVLGLDPEAFASHPSYPGGPPLPPEVVRLVLPFGDLGVNVWLVRAPGATLLFDAGSDPEALDGELRRLAVHRLDAAFITHDHPDHVAGLAVVRRLTGRIFSPDHETLRGTEPIEPHAAHEFGGVRVVALASEGHTPGALSYRVDGLSAPVCVVGDALFAGSMGGCPDRESYLLARMRIGDQILTLPGATVLLPGHGPVTSVAIEQRHNPFFAGAAGVETNG